jgi:hypothetical protein
LDTVRSGRGFLPQLLFVCLAVLAPAAAPAQTWDVAGGYSYLRDTKTDLDFSRGWLASVARKVHGVWAVGEVDGHYSTLPFVIGQADLSIHSFLAGGRIGAKVGRFREFAQLLGGGVRSQGAAFGSSSSDFRGTVQLGLGLDAPLPRNLWARVQLDTDGKLGEVRMAATLAYSFP